jgi:restriction endonuclease S subunit
MEAMTKTLDLKNIDKAKWEAFRFDEIAAKISETVDPNTTELKTYVGLEHLDAENIHIKRFGTPDDVSGGKLKCYPGDVIFGKRRAYQRKAAIANFEGICSAHAFVFRANAKVIDPNLFPFFLHSDQFMHRMVDISVGGLSPTINWGDLKHQEFLLPPKDQQAQLAELLWAMDEVVERENGVNVKLKKQLLACESEIFSKKNYQKLNYAIIKTLSGGTPDTKQSEFYNNGDVPWITTKILESDFIEKGEKLITNDAVKNSAAKTLPKGNIVAGTRVGVGKFAINLVDMSFSQDVTGLLIDHEKVDIEYLVYQLNSHWFQKMLAPLLRGTTIKGIIKEDLLKMKIFLPSRDQQISIREELKAIKESSLNIESKITSSKSLQKSLINQIF